MVKIAKTLLGLAAFAMGLLVILYGLSDARAAKALLQRERAVKTA